MLSIACMYITGGPIFPIDPHPVEKRKVEQDELWTAKAIPGKERKMSHPPAFTVRADDLLRHLQDLRSPSATPNHILYIVYSHDFKTIPK